MERVLCADRTLRPEGGGRVVRRRDWSECCACIVLANWFNPGDEACEEAMYDTRLFREFCRIDWGKEGTPDATTLPGFRHLLEAHEWGAVLLAKERELLQAHGLGFSGGTIVDATLIEAPCSTRNREKARDTEMRSTQKGNPWHFGMKERIGADSRSGIVHPVSVTAAKVHDRHEVPNLLFGDETRFHGDSACRSKEQRKRLKELAPRAKDFTNRRACRNRPLSEADQAANRRKSKVRAEVEHPFLTLKRPWGFAKARYRGLAKNANRAFVMRAMINLKKWGRPLTGEVRPT